MKKLITICAVAGLIMAVTGAAQADLDIDAIIMTSVKDYLDGTPVSDPWGLEMWFEFVDTGSLHHIDVTLPGGSSVADFTIYGSAGYWDYESPALYSTLGGLQGGYGTGDYTFSFENSSDVVLRSVTLDYSGLSEPTGFADFTNPSYNGETGISTTPTFTWDVDSGDGDALGRWLWDSDTDVDVDWDVPVSITTSWAPVSLLPSNEYGLEVSVINFKDPVAGPAFPTATVGGDTFAYGLWIEYLNEIEFTTVPEPVTIAPFGLGSLFLIRRKRRA